MQTKRGINSVDNQKQVIEESTVKVNSMSTTTKVRPGQESESQDTFYNEIINNCEYDYSSKKWCIPDSFLELLNRSKTTKVDDISAVFDKLNVENKAEILDKVENAIHNRVPFTYSGNMKIESDLMKFNINGKFLSDKLNSADKYHLSLSLSRNGDSLSSAEDNTNVQTLKNMPMAYFRVNADFTWEYVNNRWEKMYGFTLEQLKGKPVDYFLPEYAKKEVKNTLKMVLSGNTVYDEFSLLNNRNNISYYSTNIYPVYDENHNIVAAEGFNQDITRLRSVEENLKIQEEKYNIIRQNIPVMVYSRIPGDEYQMLFVSGGVKELTELDIDEYFDKKGKWKELIYFEDYKYYSKKNNEQIVSKSQLNIEYRIKTKSDIIKWVRDVSTPLIDEEGKVIKINGFIEDISERKNAEKALKLSEKKFRSIFEDSRDCIYLTTRSGQFIDINSAGLKLTGYTKEELLTLNASSLYVDIADRFRFKRILEKEQYVKDFEFRLKKKNGEIRDCILSSSVSKNDFGEVKGFQGIIRDITEKKKAEREIIFAKEEAEKADRIKTEFLAQMSHEIRTPINTILSFSSLISDELHEIISPQSQEYFSILDRAGIRIIRTIDLILNMSELQSGSYKYVLSDIDLAAILYDLYAEYKSHASDKKLDLKLNISDDQNLLVKGDEYSITQIISNLIDNAIKYTESGSISINATDENDYTRLEVEDTGIGISEKYIPYLFDAFSQEEQGYTRKFEGSGLGLALVKKYCDINKARITVDSQKGLGAKFIIHFDNSSANE